jgi:DNA-binding HxlR family transcriptional regulator
VRPYGQYCPIAKAAEIVGDRWTLLLVRELLFGPLGFNELVRGLPGISRSVLVQRLRQLERLGMLERKTGGGGRVGSYRLSPSGEQLGDAVRNLGEWAARWVLTDPTQAELDPDLLVLWISRHVAVEHLPARRVVIAFELRGQRPGRLWLVLESEGASICYEDPGLPTDVWVRADTEALYRVYMGRTSLTEAVDDGRVSLHGTIAMVRNFPRWFTWSHFAATVRGSGAGPTRSTTP